MKFLGIFLLLVISSACHARPVSDEISCVLAGAIEAEHSGSMEPMVKINDVLGCRPGVLAILNSKAHSFWGECKPVSWPESFSMLWKEGIFQIPCRGGWRAILSDDHGVPSGFLGMYVAHMPYSLTGKKGKSFNSYVTTIGGEYYSINSTWHCLLDYSYVGGLTDTNSNLLDQYGPHIRELDYYSVNFKLSRDIGSHTEGFVAASFNRVLRHPHRKKTDFHGTYKLKEKLSVAVGGRLALNNVVTVSAHYFLYNPMYRWGLMLRACAAEKNCASDKLVNKLNRPSYTLQLRYAPNVENDRTKGKHKVSNPSDRERAIVSHQSPQPIVENFSSKSDANALSRRETRRDRSASLGGSSRRRKLVAQPSMPSKPFPPRQETGQNLVGMIHTRNLLALERLVSEARERKRGLTVTVDHESDKKSTPLHFAALHGWLEGIDCLLRYGENINARDEYEDVTPLWQAVYRNDIPVAYHLLGKGADCSIPNQQGITPLSLSIEKQHWELAAAIVGTMCNRQTITYISHEEFIKFRNAMVHTQQERLVQWLDTLRSSLLGDFTLEEEQSGYMSPNAWGPPEDDQAHTARGRSRSRYRNHH